MLTRAQRTYGDVVELDFRLRTYVLVSHPRAIERVLLTHSPNYTKQTRGYDVLREIVGNGLVTSEGSFWFRQRRIASPAFHRDRIAGFGATMVRCTDDMMQRWTTQRVAFDRDMMTLTMRIAGLTLLSTDVDGRGDLSAAITELVEHQVAPRVLSFVPAPSWLPTPMNRRYDQARRLLDGLIYGVIADRRRDGAGLDLLGMLMAATDEDTNEYMSDEQLRDEMLTMFLAGHETTAASLSFAMALLCQHPDVQERAFVEVGAAVGNGELDVAATQRMPYLDALFDEVMRLYPPVATVTRTCVAEDELDGCRIGAGQLVLMSPWVTHHHPSLWEEPEVFRPERFLAGGEAHHSGRPRYAYFPFLGGPRKCIGEAFARLEQKLVLARLLQRYRFSLAPGTDISARAMGTIRARHGVPVDLALR
jgi:cytochrome P450